MYNKEEDINMINKMSSYKKSRAKTEGLLTLDPNEY